jgi:hypothetical protein
MPLPTTANEFNISRSSTGDLDANVGRLSDALRAASLPLSSLPAPRALRAADPAALLPLLHWALLDMSPHVARLARERLSFSLFAADDLRFARGALELARGPPLRVEARLAAAQLLAPAGCFAERKLNFVADVVRACAALHADGERAAAPRRRGPVPPYAGHFALSPASASTRDAVRVQQISARAERAVVAGASDVWPPRLVNLPRGRRGASSDCIYSCGGGEEGVGRLTEVDEKEVLEAAERFLSSAVMLGLGACAAMTTARRTRRAQVGTDRFI